MQFVEDQSIVKTQPGVWLCLFSFSVSCATAPTIRGGCCIFPFKDGKTKLTSCTAFQHNRAWCATSPADKDGYYSWENCVGKDEK